MEIVLSICICTTSARSEIIKPLLARLNPQIAKYNGAVELVINDHETDCVGKKRNTLLLQAKGEWQVSVDSDDMVSADYVDKIMSALKQNPDCVGISGVITTNGRDARAWHISKSFGSWYEQGKQYYRTPNHISPIRTSIARQVMFPEKNFAEDYDFSMRVLPLLKSEVRVPGELYHYQFIQNKKHGK